MHASRISVATLASRIEAEVICERLCAAGIPATVDDGADRQNGEPAASGFHVRVAEADFARAMGILFPIPDLDGSGAAAPPALPETDQNWTCATCGESVAYQASRCWKCGSLRDPSAPLAGDAWPPMEPGPASFPRPESASGAAAPWAASAPPLGFHIVPGMAGVEAPFPPFPEPTRPASDSNTPISPGASPTDSATAATATADAPRIVVAPSPARGGFASPRRRGAPTPALEQPVDLRQGDRAAKRAWITAIIGLASLPLFVGPVVSFYSVCVLLESGFRSWRMSARGNLMYYGALVLNAATFTATGYWLSRI